MVFVIGGAVLALALIAHERISFAPVCSRFTTIFQCGRQFCLPPALSLGFEPAFGCGYAALCHALLRTLGHRALVRNPPDTASSAAELLLCDHRIWRAGYPTPAVPALSVVSGRCQRTPAAPESRAVVVKIAIGDANRSSSL